MLCIEKICQAPENSGTAVLGRTLPSLLDEACDSLAECSDSAKVAHHDRANSQALNQFTQNGWQPISHQLFRSMAESVALGLLDLGLKPLDRVAFLLFSDVHFCVADMGCLLARLVDVPIDLTQTLENIVYVLQHSESKALIVANLDLLAQVAPYLWDAPDLEFVIVAEVPDQWQKSAIHQDEQSMPEIPKQSYLENHSDAIEAKTVAAATIPFSLPQGVQVFSLDDLRGRGEPLRSEQRSRQLRDDLSPTDLATIVYIPVPAGQLEGVMLTHENLSANALASFSGLDHLEFGNRETVVSFLPLTHVFARSLLYGHVNYGHSIYFSNPNRVIKHLKEIQPTLLASVPLLLEKLYSKILDRGDALPTIERNVFYWALGLAKHYNLSKPARGWYAVLLKIADWLVLSQWRSLFGGRLKYLLCGGAALRAELATVFRAAGVLILQGYGLTQTSSVICYNRDRYNRAGTVGVPIAGVEIAISRERNAEETSKEGEILLRGPYLTPGYYKNLEATRELIDADGWLHTGDLGRISEDGFLSITGVKKALFKLATGKYITPQSIEQRLKQSPFVAHAVAVGLDRKFCALLIFPNLDALHQYMLDMKLNIPSNHLLHHPCMTRLYQALVDAANCHLPYWATVKRFRLIDVAAIVENGELTPIEHVNRSTIVKFFAHEIEVMYRETNKKVQIQRLPPFDAPDVDLASIECPIVPTEACPAFAQSLDPRFTH